MTFKERVYECVPTFGRCDNRIKKLAWDNAEPPSCTFHGTTMVEVPTSWAGNRGVIDDQIEGGPRFFETFGHEPVWIDSKSEWRRQVDKHQVVNVVRHDSAYYAKQRKMHDERLRDEKRV